jgi:hypothetical protein
MTMQVQLQLAKQTEESRLHQDHVQQLEAQYSEQFKKQDRALKDIAAAMHQEEQAKISAEKRLRTAKEQCVSLEDEVRALARKLDDAHSRCQEAAIDRDEYQVRPTMPRVDVWCIFCMPATARMDSLLFLANMNLLQLKSCCTAQARAAGSTATKRTSRVEKSVAIKVYREGI